MENQNPNPPQKTNKKKLGPFSTLGIGGDKEFFIENLSLLVSSGTDTISALKSLQQEVKTKGMKKVIGLILEDVQSGESLSNAIQNTHIFSVNVTSLISVGEQSGRLSENLKVIANQERKEKSFRSKISSAMLYPAFVICLTFIVGIAITWFILPRLATVFSQLKIELPLITRILIQSGNFLNQYGLIFLPLFFFIAALLIYFLFIFNKTKFIGQSLIFHLTGINSLVKNIEIARFGTIVSGLLNAGVPMTTSLNSAAQTASFYQYQRLFHFLETKIQEGDSFQQSFSAYKRSEKLIPLPIQQMIFAAEQSGNLATTFSKIGEVYEERSDTSAKNLAVILEPILLVIVWLGVVAVAIAVILPIYSLLGGINNNPATPPTSNTQEVVPLNTPTPTPVSLQQLEVQDTGIGYLNVRQLPSTDSSIITRALPGESYTYLRQDGEWYKIILTDPSLSTQSGWVNGAYVLPK